jgi:hypothetical protein
VDGQDKPGHDWVKLSRRSVSLRAKRSNLDTNSQADCFVALLRSSQ